MEQQPHNPAPDLRNELQAMRELIRQQSHQIARLEALLKDVFEITLLPEAERQQRAADHRARRLQSLKQQIDRVLQQRRFDLLEPLVIELQNVFGDCPDAEELKLRAWAARDAALAETLTQLESQVLSLTSVGHWRSAEDAVRQQLVLFPDQPELLSMIQRIRHEHEAWRETAIGKLYAQIKDAIDRREWRRALRDAEDMAARFADHPRGAKIVQQLSTIRDNAEIEARQELEKRIQELIRSRRFDEAISLAEELINRYPLSPQAAECRALVPKLEELALHEEADRLSR